MSKQQWTFLAYVMLFASTYVHANPVATPGPLEFVFVCLIPETIVLLVLLRKYIKVKTGFFIVWPVITITTWVCLWFYLAAYKRILYPDRIDKFDGWVGVISGEVMVVLVEALILWQYVRLQENTEYKPLKLSPNSALFASACANTISFLLGIMLLQLYSSL